MTRPQPIIDPWVVDRSRDLLERSYLILDNADGLGADADAAGAGGSDDAERFRQYYLAALRGAGAVLALHEPRVRPVRGRRTGRNAWSRMAAVAPDLAQVAEAFAVLSRTRMEIESGIIRTVDSARVAVLRARVLAFLGVVEQRIIAYEQGKLPHQAPMSRDSA